MFRFTKREEMILLVIIITLVIGSGIIAVKYFTDQKADEIFVADSTKDKTVESKEDKSEEQQPEDKEADEILVQVGGEVSQPGVYKLRDGSRVFQLLNKAGGITSKADLDQMNLVEELKDGEKIIVPKKIITEEVEEKKTAGEENNQEIIEEGKINLNTASKNELKELYRVGPALADRIIEYRNQHGGFDKISELKEVPRIGEKIFQENKDRLTVR